MHAWYGVVVVLGAIGSVVAQDNSCALLLQHGIYDTYRQHSGAVSSSQFHTNLCDAYNRYKRDQQTGSVQVSYGILGGGGDYSASQLDVLGKTMCTTTDSSAFSQNDLAIFSSTIDQQAVLAFSDCMKAFGYGLRTKTDVRESDAGHLTLSINFVPLPGSPGTIELRYVRVDPADSWSCGGTLWDRRNGNTKLDTTVYSLSCERTFAQFTTDGRQYKAKPSTVTVATSVATVNANFAAEPSAPAPVPGAFPIGAIVPFWGSKADAEKLKGSGWWPCDGTAIADQLSPLYNSHAPNLADAFLRGSTVAAGATGGSQSAKIPDQPISSTYDGWSDTPGNGAPEMWVLKGGMGFATGVLQKVRGLYHGTDIGIIPPYQTVIYLIRIR